MVAGAAIATVFNYIGSGRKYHDGDDELGMLDRIVRHEKIVSNGSPGFDNDHIKILSTVADQNAAAGLNPHSPLLPSCGIEVTRRHD